MYHKLTTLGFTWKVKLFNFFIASLFYQHSGEIEASFFTRRKSESVIRIFGKRAIYFNILSGYVKIF